MKNKLNMFVGTCEIYIDYSGMGMASACGHVDFYPNGGVRMPGCGNGIIDAVIMEDGNLPYGWNIIYHIKY